MSKEFLESVENPENKESVREIENKYRENLPEILRKLSKIQKTSRELLTVRHSNLTEKSDKELLVHKYYEDNEYITVETILGVKTKGDSTYKRVGRPGFDTLSYEQFAERLKPNELREVAKKLSEYGL